MEQENAHAGVGEGDVRRQDQGVAPVGTVEAEGQGDPDGGRAETAPKGELRPAGQEQVRPGQIKIEVVGLDKDNPADHELFDKFRKLFEGGYESFKGFADRFKLKVEPGAHLKITRQMLETAFPRSGASSMTVGDFLAKYANPDDLAAYNRVARLRGLYDTLYKPRLP